MRNLWTEESEPGLGNVPGHALPRRRLHLHEVCEDAHLGCAGSAHDDQPEVQLGFGPLVFASAFDDADYFCRRHCVGLRVVRFGGGRREKDEAEGGGPWATFIRVIEGMIDCWQGYEGILESGVRRAGRRL